MRTYNETLYDRDTIIRFNRYYLANFFKKNFSIIAVGAAVAAGYSFSVGEWETAVLILGMIVAYAILTYVIQITTRNKALKKSPIAEHPIIRTYLFGDEGIEIDGRFVHPENVEPEMRGPKSRTLKYDEIVRIATGREFMVIYDNERRTYIVDLKSFENPMQYGALRTFLAQRFGKRFK
ncbi:MAG: hypothetical protein WC509_05290 [Candidatus Izemoplasmatales bacterium]